MVLINHLIKLNPCEFGWANDKSKKWSKSSRNWMDQIGELSYELMVRIYLKLTQNWSNGEGSRWEDKKVLINQDNIIKHKVKSWKSQRKWLHMLLF